MFIKLLSLFILASCSTAPKISGTSKAEVLFKEAKGYAARKRYFQANEKLNQLRSKYPYSYFSIPAELMGADILFEQKTYLEATAAYLSFKDLHPKHEKSDYVLYMIGQSYYKQMPSTPDRDLTFARQSLIYFRELKQRFPQSKYAKKVDKELDKAAAMIWGREKYIADFYFKTKEYQAANARYLDILKLFPDLSELNDHAKSRLIISSYKSTDYKKCLGYLKQFASTLSEKTAGKLTSYADKCAEGIKDQMVKSKES